jgi:hypothetical protein
MTLALVAGLTAMTFGAASGQTARLQVIHNAADPAAASVDVYLNGSVLLDDFGFREATAFIDAPAGTPLDIGVAPGNSSSADDTLKNFQVTLVEGETYVAVANGVLDPAGFASNPDGMDIAFTLFLKDQIREAASGSDVDFIVLHGATDAPTVDVIARDVATLVDDAAYGDMTSYLSVPPASYVLDVTPGNDNSTIVASFEADLSGLGGGAAVVFASGFLDPAANQNGQPFGILAALPDGSVAEFPAITTARLQVIHNAADPAAASVDVYLNGGILLDDFGFREATAFIDASANTPLDIGVAPGTSSSADDTLKNFQVTLVPGETYVAIANGVLDPAGFASNPDGMDIAFTLFIKDGVREAGTGSDVDFIVLHGATDAPTVDVIARDVATLVDDAAYGAITDYIAVPPASYILDIALGGDPGTVVASFQADLSALGGGSAVIAASGFLDPSANQNGEAFGLIAVLADGTVLTLPAEPLGADDVGGTRPTAYGLSQNTPNPFNSTTSISFSVPQSEFVSLTVTNVLGRKVASLVNGRLGAGNYTASFDARGLAAGTYLCVLDAGSFKSVREMTVLR